MAEPGWYPDPEGAPGRYRYWDGRRWGADSVDGPPDHLLPAGADTGSGPRHGGRTAGLVVAILLLVALIVAGIVFFVRTGTNAVDPNPPGPSISGWDDSSPRLSPGPSPSPTPGRTPSPTPTPSPGPSSAAPTPQPTATVALPVAHCPAGEPGQSIQHPADGRVYGGALSFPRISGGGFAVPSPDHTYGWWYDEHSQVTSGDPAVTARVAVGSVAIRSGFQTPAQAARSSLLCAIRAGGPGGYTGYRIVSQNRTTVDGQQAARIVADVNRSGRGAGDRITVIVVNAGPPGSYSIFLATAPTGDDAGARVIAAAIKGLRVSG